MGGIDKNNEQEDFTFDAYGIVVRDEIAFRTTVALQHIVFASYLFRNFEKTD